MKSSEMVGWNPSSWQTRKALQQPHYADPTALATALTQLARLPPLVVSWEIDGLRERLAVLGRGAEDAHLLDRPYRGDGAGVRMRLAAAGNCR